MKKGKLPNEPNIRYVNLAGQEMHTYEEFYKDQVERLIPYYKMERATRFEGETIIPTTKFCLECIAETYIKIDNDNVNIGLEAQRRLKSGEF